MEESRPSAPTNDEPVIVGRVLAPFGVQGEVKVEPLTSFPERLSRGRRIFIAGHALVIEEGRLHGKLVLIKFEDVDTVKDAEALRGQMLQIPAEELTPLPEGEYYYYQIIGLEVWTTGGKFLGRIVEVLETGSNDVYIVKSDNREVLIPATEEVVQSIELDKGRMEIEAIPGLLD